MDDVNESKYINLILSIIDYDFIRRTTPDFKHLTDEQIKYLFLTGNDDIIVSQVHAQLITQNNLFDYEFYKSHYPVLAHMNPSDVLNHYLIYGRDEKYIVSHEHAKILTKNPNFNIDFYSTFHKDLRNMGPIQLVNHYIRFDNKENRQCY